MIFARPRHEYESYRDFWRMVELCGFPLIYQDQIDVDVKTTYILTGADATLEFPEGDARIIYWLLEWYIDYYQRPGVHETWCSNKTFAEKLGLRFVPCGSMPELGTLHRNGEEFDIAHMSYDKVYRRSFILDRLREDGLKIAPNGWGKERDKILRNCRAMLHIHQHDHTHAIAPLRAALAAAYGLPLISENGVDNVPYIGFFADYDSLRHVVNVTLKRNDLKERGLELHQRLCHDLCFDKVINGAV